MAHGDTRIIPAELQESMYPFRLIEFSLREDSGGAGKFRGGLGFRKRYLMLGDCDLQAMFEDHLGRCANCQRFLAQYFETIRAGRAAFVDPDADATTEVPEDLVRAILRVR